MKIKLRSEIYYSAGILFLFLAALLLVNTLFFRKSAINNLVTRVRTQTSQLSSYDKSDMKTLAASGSLNFYAAAYSAKKETMRSLPESAALTPVAAVEKARAFLKGKGITSGLDYYDVKNGGLTVTFYNAQDGAKDFSFPTTVEFDEHYGVSSFEYYERKYDKICAANAKTADEAMRELPPMSGKVKLTSCELGYFYADSVLQPAWRFLGKYEESGGDFEEFVRAAKY